MPLKTSRCRYGFTLIELLVVITIIGILAALLVPAFSKVRFKYRCMVCASNLHQWALAATLYAQDNRGQLPRFDMVVLTGGNMTDIKTNYVSDFLARYLPATNMWFCPLDQNPDAVSRRFVSPWWSEFYLVTSYSWWGSRILEGSFPTTPVPWYPASGSFVPSVNVHYPMRLSDPGLSRLPIAADCLVSVSSSVNSQLQGNHVWRGQVDNANCAFADGHVEVHPRSQIALRWTGNRYNFY